jgi:hypothetical protein
MKQKEKQIDSYKMKQIFLDRKYFIMEIQYILKNIGKSLQGGRGSYL